VGDVLDERRIIQRIREDLGHRTRGADPVPRAPAAAPPGAPPLDDVRLLHSGFDILDTGPLPSPRKIFGPAVTFGRRIVRRLMMPILTRQIAYNAANTRVVQDLRSDLGAAVRQQESAIAGQQAAITGIRDALNPSMARVAALEHRLDGTAATAHALEQRLDETRGYLGHRLDDLARALERRLDAEVAIGRRLDLASGVERETAVRLATLRADLDRAALRQDRLDRRFAALGGASAAQGAATPAPPAGDPAVGEPPPRSGGIDYAGLEDRFRGSEAEIKERQRPYLRHFRGRDPVLDIGCGRGEFLELLSEAGIAARGVDADRDMVLLCRDKGLDVAEGDASAQLAAMPDGSLGGIFCAQFIEHFRPEQIQRLARLCHEKLRPGGVLVFETINPACVSVFGRSFYLDPTHVWPFHPELTRFLLEGAGFREITLELLSPVDPATRLPHVGPPAFADADAALFNRAADMINATLLGHQDYALIGIRSSDAV